MRWLWEWLTWGVEGGTRSRQLARLRDGVARVRRRADYHRECLDEARGEFDRASRRVRFFEISEDAEVSDLVVAHRNLLRARDAVEHHEERLRTARGAYEMMAWDRLRLQEGLDPEHWEAYSMDLDR
jgi:predicted  nucleic acid-binding Zn-ribbon protein